MNANLIKLGRKAHLALTLLAVFAVSQAGALESPIQSSGASGRLVFESTPAAQGYRVEWAPTPTGPWIDTWSSLVDLSSQGSIITCSVPLCYRVMASLSDYLVIDLSGGTTATNYPITLLSDVPAGGWTDEYKTDKLVMRLVPSGTFIMGSPEDEMVHCPGEDQHQVTLTKGFYVGVFEVTQRQWELVMGNRPSYFSDNATYASRPVEQVSYDNIRGSTGGAGWPATNAVDAASFLGRLREKTGLTTVDLPTEAQWEYACRAGTTTGLNSGKNLAATQNCPNTAEVAWYLYNSGGSTTKVGPLPPNAWGVYDMHGNVREWCRDWHGDYAGDATDPSGPGSGSARMMRGGCFGTSAWLCRSALRWYRPPYDMNNDSFGFRLVWTLP